MPLYYNNYTFFFPDMEPPVLSRVEYTDSGFPLIWQQNASITCNYLIEWLDASCRHDCPVEWIRVNAGSTNISIESGMWSMWAWKNSFSQQVSKELFVTFCTQTYLIKTFCLKKVLQCVILLYTLIIILFVFSVNFQPGVRYNFSLYSCPSSSPQLIQRWQGYMLELGKLNQTA